MKRFSAILAILLTATLLLWGATAGPSFAGTGADDSSVGTVTWSNPTNVTASDNTRANVTTTTASETSHYIKATNFGFSIGGGTVDGILCEVEQFGTFVGGSSVPNENSIRLVNGAGTIIGDNKSTSAALPNGSGNEAFVSYGGSADTWSASLTPSDINDTDFGCVYSVDLNSDGADDSDGFVDSIRITVTHSPGVGGRRRIITRNAGTVITSGAESELSQHSQR